MLAAVDLGGSNTDILLADADGAVTRSVVLRGYAVLDAGGLSRALDGAGAERDSLQGIAVTGGRSRSLPAMLGGIPLHRVEEPEAIGRGGLLASGLGKALVMSMGTGTALVAAGPEGFRHLGGTAVGGGTVLGLARLMLRTTDPIEIGDLAAHGSPRAVDLSVGDIVGGPVGIIPAGMTASHFGKVGRLADDAPLPAPEDLAAGLLELVGQVLGRLGLMAARSLGFERLVLTGHVADWPGVAQAITRVGGTFGGDVVVPPDPGFATARGALAALMDG